MDIITRICPDCNSLLLIVNGFLRKSRCTRPDVRMAARVELAAATGTLITICNQIGHGFHEIIFEYPIKFSIHSIQSIHDDPDTPEKRVVYRKLISNSIHGFSVFARVCGYRPKSCIEFGNRFYTLIMYAHQ